MQFYQNIMNYKSNLKQIVFLRLMYLYSNIIGTFVFNQNFQVREKVIFKKTELIKIKEKFDNDEILDSEKKFLKKFKKIFQNSLEIGSGALRHNPW